MANTQEQSLIMIKPDGVRRKLISNILSYFEEEFNIVAMKMMRFSKKLASQFYEIHKGKFFFDELIEYITSGNVVAFIIEGEDCVHRARKLIGDTDPKIAEKNTIRGRFGINKTENTVHASDSPYFAEYEINLLFKRLNEDNTSFTKRRQDKRNKRYPFREA